MKKIITVFLAMVLAAVMGICPAFAASAPEMAIASPAVKGGEDFDVTISLKNNPGIISAKLIVKFDGDLALKKVSYGKNLGGTSQQPQSLNSPVTLNWVSPTKELKSDEVFATLSFTASNKAANGEHKIEVSYNPDDVFDMSEKNVDFKVTGGVVTVSGGSSKAVSSAAADTKKTDTSSEEATEKKSTGDDTTAYYDGDGNYTGGEEVLEFEDKDGNPISSESTVGEDKKDTTPIWVFSVVAALLIVAIVAIIIVKKKTDKKTEE